MSMTVGTATIKYIDGPGPEAADFLEYVLEKEPDDVWMMRDQGSSLIETEIETLQKLAGRWQQDRGKDSEEYEEVRDWLRELEAEHAPRSLIMLYASA